MIGQGLYCIDAADPMDECCKIGFFVTHSEAAMGLKQNEIVSVSLDCEPAATAPTKTSVKKHRQKQATRITNSGNKGKTGSLNVLITCNIRFYCSMLLETSDMSLVHYAHLSCIEPLVKTSTSFKLNVA